MTRSGIEGVRSLVSSTARACAGLRGRQLGSVAVRACARAGVRRSTGSGTMRKPSIYTGVRMLENFSMSAKKCQIVQSETGRPRRNIGSVSPTRASPSEMGRACSSGSKALRHHAPRNWHAGTEALFTMSSDRTEGGNQDGGRRSALPLLCASPPPRPEAARPSKGRGCMRGAERSQFWKNMFKTQSQESVEISVKTGVDRGLDQVKNEANQAENEAMPGRCRQAVLLWPCRPESEMDDVKKRGGASVRGAGPRWRFGLVWRTGGSTWSPRALPWAVL
jgi:hypothetical protein